MQNTYATISTGSAQAKIFAEGVKITIRAGNVYIPDKDSDLLETSAALSIWAGAEELSGDQKELCEALVMHWDEIHKIFKNLGRCERVFIHRLLFMEGHRESVFFG